MTERELKERIGISNSDGTQHPEYTIDGKRYNTNQIRRKVPLTPNIQHDYWYAVTSVSYKPTDDELKPLVEYVDKLVNGNKRTVTRKVTSDDNS